MANIDSIIKRVLRNENICEKKPRKIEKEMSWTFNLPVRFVATCSNYQLSHISRKSIGPNISQSIIRMKIKIESIIMEKRNIWIFKYFLRGYWDELLYSLLRKRINLLKEDSIPFRRRCRYYDPYLIWKTESKAPSIMMDWGIRRKLLNIFFSSHCFVFSNYVYVYKSWILHACFIELNEL